MMRRLAACATVIVFGLGGVWIPPIWGAFRDDTHNPGNRFRVGEFVAPIATATASAIATASELACDLGPLVTACPTAPSPSANAFDPATEPDPATELKPATEPEPAPESEPKPEPATEPEPEPKSEPRTTAAASEPVADGAQVDQPRTGESSA